MAKYFNFRRFTALNFPYCQNFTSACQEQIEVVETSLKRKNIITRIISTFLHFSTFSLLTLNISFLTVKITYRFRTSPRAQKQHQATQIYLWVSSGEYTYILQRNNVQILPAIQRLLFLIWTGTTDQLMKFKQQINEVHLSIKLEFNLSNKEINVLDFRL